MKKTNLFLILIPLCLVGCNNTESSECECKNSSISNSNSEEGSSSVIDSDSNTSSDSSTQVKATSISILGGKQTIPYGSVLDELNFSVLLSYSDGSTKILNNDEYTLEFEKDATFLVGDGKATLTYKEDATISNEVEYVVTPRKNASILFIGNSFSDDTIEYMLNVASSLGIGLKVNNLYIGSSTLNDHYFNLKNNSAAYEYRSWNGSGWSTKYSYKISTALKQEKWDFVSLQQGSGSSGLYSTYSHLNDCIDLIQKDLLDKAHTQFIWNMTWAYQQNSTHGEFVNYGNNQMQMYNSIVSCVQKLDRDIFKVIIPTGTAIQNARTSTLGDTLTRDGFHLNVGAGRYIASLNAVKAITGVEYETVPFSPSLNAATKEICLESVDNAWKNPYEVTKSTYAPEESEDLSELIKNMDKLPITFTRDRYYYCISATDKSNTLGPDKRFICTNLFTKEDIPNGSIIHIAPGYRYRPDGWVDLDTYWTGDRPENVNTEYVEVNDEWWGEFQYRGFNISNTSGTDLSDNYEQAENAFSIYVPKK